MGWITLPNELDEEERQWIRNKEIPRMQNSVINSPSLLDHNCSLEIGSLPHRSIRLTNIICNIGYSVNRDVESLQKLMMAGMNIARIHLSLNHEDLEFHTQTIRNIRQAAENYSKVLGVPYPVGIASNTIGSEIRTGYLERGEESDVELKTGNIVKLTTDPAYKDKCSAQVIFVDYEDIFSRIVVGRSVYIDNGEIQLKIISISGAFMSCKIIMGGTLGNQRGINLPGTLVDLPALSSKDLLYINFAIEQKLDFLFCAFIKNKEAVLEIRNALGHRGRHIKVISKIEDVQGFQNLDDIISVSDGVVIARGDLFLEFSCPKLTILQKYMTAKCMKYGCPVLVSRELMETMMIKKLATRAEVCDVANVVIDSADCLLLARETLKGQYGVDIVKFISQICKEAEAIAWREDWPLNFDNIANTISMTAVDAAIKCRASAIFVLTETGNVARIISQYRPRCPIVAVTRNARVSRQLHLYRAVIPFHYTSAMKREVQEEVDAQVDAAIAFGRDRLFIRSNDPIVIIVDMKTYKKLNNTLRIQYVSEIMEVISDGSKVNMYIQ